MRLLQYIQLLFLTIFSQCITPPKAAGQFTEQEFDKMATKMALGSVPEISVAGLRQLQEKTILLDTREQKEFAVSHIPGAIWVGYDDFKLERLEGIPKDARIVTYCSVGYRSERIGEQLQKAGFKDVSNLKGSIFKWVNDGHEIIDEAGRPTDHIHGYDQKWGKWLKKGKVVYN